MKWIILILFLPMFSTIAAQQKAAAPKQWHIAATLPGPKPEIANLGIAGPVAGVHNEMLFVGGGANFPEAMPWLGGAKKYYDELFVYEQTKNGLRLKDVTFRLPIPVAYSASCSTPEGIVVAGGETSSGLSDKVLLIEWDKRSSKPIISNLPYLPVALTNASITTDGQMVYLAGGETSAAASDLFLRLNLSDTALGWQQLPRLPQPTSHAVLVFLQKENSIHLIGGRKKNENGISDLYASNFSFDVSSGKWHQKKSLPYPLSAGTGVAAVGTSIFLFGGDKGETFHRAETLIAAIANEEDTAQKALLNQQKIRVQSTHPGFSNAILQYDAALDEWTETGTVPFAVPVTTTTIKWKNCVFITSGEIKAGVRTPYILAALMP